MVLTSRTGGVFLHASSIFQAEALRAVHMLKLAGSAVSAKHAAGLKSVEAVDSENASKSERACTYVYVRWPMANNGRIIPTLFRTGAELQALANGGHKLDQFFTPWFSPTAKHNHILATVPLHVLAAVVVNVSRARDVLCVRWSAIHSSEIVEHAITRIDPRFEVYDVHAIGNVSAKAERHHMLQAPLLITEVGTHNTDFMLMKRAMQRDSPSLVMNYTTSAEVLGEPTWCTTNAPRPHERAMEHANSCAGCLFWRGLCLRGPWHRPLAHEMIACDLLPREHPGCG